MKIQLLTATALLALTTTAVQATPSMGQAPVAATITNTSENALAIGDSTGGATGFVGLTVDSSGGRAIAGSVYLSGDACACDFATLDNNSTNAMAVGSATAGSIQISQSVSAQ